MRTSPPLRHVQRRHHHLSDVLDLAAQALALLALDARVAEDKAELQTAALDIGPVFAVVPDGLDLPRRADEEHATRRSAGDVQRALLDQLTSGSAHQII